MVLTDGGRGSIIGVFPDSSMVEQEAVNFEVAGSSPARGAKHRHYGDHGVFAWIILFLYNNVMSLELMLANANGNLSSVTPVVEAAAIRAENFVREKLKADYGINMIVAEMDLFLIPEDGVGGRTYRADFVLVTLDLKKKLSEDILYEIFCHELCHAVRWGANPEYMMTLFDGLISEGIATVFEELATANNKSRQVFLDTIINRSDEDNKKVLSALQPHLENSNYNYDEIFFGGNAELPRWAGYSAGYYLVKQYLQTTGKTIEQAFADKYTDFKVILNCFTEGEPRNDDDKKGFSGC